MDKTEDLTTLSLKYRLRTHAYLNLESKLGLESELGRDLFFDAVGITPIGAQPTALGNYGAMFRERNASMHSGRIPGITWP